MENKDCKSKISSFWQKWQERKQNYEDPTISWDNGKKFIQGITKDFCTELKETEKKRLHQLQLELQTLHIQKNKDQIKINNIESEIEEIERHHQKGAMIRSRTKLIENEENPQNSFTQRKNKIKIKKI